MRSNPSSNTPIWQAWSAGHALVGGLKPHSVITVEPGWSLRTQSPAGSRTVDKLPIRYFQVAANNQTEIELPGVRSWDVEYSIDQDVATLHVHLVNNLLDPDFTSAGWANSNGDFGQVGYLTPTRGTTTNRWGYQPNAWANVLTANAALRLYTGYAPDGMSLSAALAAGNMVLSGIFFIDDTPIQTGQKFELVARNPGKFLVEQTIYPPLVPAGDYPMSRSAFYYPQVVTPKVVYGHLAANPNYRILKADRDLHGDGYWLAGSDGGTFAFGLAHWYGSLESLSPPATQVPAAYPNEGVTGISRTSTGAGYYLVNHQGQLWTFGDAVYHGGLSLGPSPTHPVISVDNAPTLDGYWLTCDDGSVYGYGAATNHGGNPPLPAGDKIVDLAATNTGLGYWLVSQNGSVFSYGDAVYYGGVATTLTAGQKIVAITPTITGLGYYLAGRDGGVFCYGDARFMGSVPALSATETFTDVNTVSGSPFISTNSAEFLSGDATASITGTNIPTGTTIQTVISPTQVRLSNNCTGTTSPGLLGTVTFTRTNAGLTLNDPISDIMVSVDGSGYWLVAEDGGVFSFRRPGSHMEFLGSLPGATVNNYPVLGNYSDISDVVRDLALYAGFYLYDGGQTDSVYGNIENTGITVGGDQYQITLDATFFDKKHVLEPLTKLREICGFSLYVDDEGALHFHEPNIYASGNYLPNNTHSNEIPVIDERVQLTDYKLNLPDKDLRSQIIISSEDPDASIPGTVTTVFTPASATGLRGMVKPAIFVNEALLNATEQETMAELIALQIQFMSRLGTVTMMGNPLVGPNDQVQIFERETGELNYHYVRSHRMAHDRKTGVFQSVLTTHFLSPPTGGWAVVKPANSPSGTVTTNRHL